VICLWKDPEIGSNFVINFLLEILEILKFKFKTGLYFTENKKNSDLRAPKT